MIFGNSWEEETYSSRSLDTLLSSVNVRVSVSRSICPSYLVRERGESQYSNGGCAREFIQVSMQTKGYEPSKTEVLEHLNLQRGPDAPIYE